MQEPMVPSNRNIQLGLQSPLATPSAHQVAGCNLWYYSNHKQILTTELTYYRNINIRGIVNDTTAHAQKHDVRVTSILLSDVHATSCIIISYNNILVVWVMCMEVGCWGADWWRATFILIVPCASCAWSQADAIREQQVKRMQSGNSSWSRVSNVACIDYS